MKIARTAKPPNVIHAINQKTFTIQTSKVDLVLFRKSLSNPFKNIAAVHYNSSAHQELQFSRHSIVQDNDIKMLAQNCRNEVEVSEEYFAYHVKFIEMLKEFQLV